MVSKKCSFTTHINLSLCVLVSSKLFIRTVYLGWVPNRVVLAGIFSMYTLLKQGRLRWLGHVIRMADSRISKDLLYGELVQGKCPIGRPQLWYKDICKLELKALGMDLNRWETLTSERSAWRQVVQHGLSQFKETLVQQAKANPAVPTPAKSGSWTGDRLYLSSVWKGLSLSNWPSQPH